MNNNNNKFKLLARIAKNKGIYQLYRKFIQELKSGHSLPMEDASNTIFSLYQIFMNSTLIREKYRREYCDEYINDLAYDITEKISYDKSLELFKNFVIKKHSEKTWNNFLNYISAKFISDNFIPYVKGHSYVSKYKVILEGKTNEEIIKQLPITCYMMHAFHWSETPQGNDFWRDINDNWMIYLNDYVINELYNNKK